MISLESKPIEMPLLLTAKQIMARLKISERTVRRMDDELDGEMPAAVRVVGTRWIRAEIDEWIRERMPSLVGDRFRYRGKGLSCRESALTLLTMVETASLLGISSRSLSRLDSAGQIPAPVRGRRTRWYRHEIEEWVDLGCPLRQNDSKRAS